MGAAGWRYPLFFVDTNVLVYARDASESEKQHQAAQWLQSLWAGRSGRLSAQVLNEYYVVVTEKLRPGLDRDQVHADIRDLMAWDPVRTGRAVVEGAWVVQDRHGLSWRDALVVSAAQIAGCAFLLTEDLEHGSDLGGIRVVDPFQMAPDQTPKGSPLRPLPASFASVILWRNMTDGTLNNPTHQGGTPASAAPDAAPASAPASAPAISTDVRPEPHEVVSWRASSST